MKNSLILTLLFLCLSSNVFSQNSERNSFGNQSSYVSFSPLSLADVFFPRFRTGYVQNINGRWKIGADLGYGSLGMGFGRELGESYQLWEIRPEIYRVFNPEAKTIKYLAAEFFYIKQNNVFTNGDYDLENGGSINYTRADYQRIKYGMHLKFGLFLDIGKNFGFNFYGGFGFRVRNNEYSNVINPQNTDILREWYVGPKVSEGQDVLVNPSLGFKFYYKI